MSLKFTPATMHGSQVGMKRDLRFTPSLPSGLSSAGHTLRNREMFAPSDRGMIGRTSLKYTPAWVRNNIDPKREHQEFTLDWWTDTAIFNYDALLVSAFYGMDIWDFREFYNIPTKDFTFIADSGGFQLWSQNVKIDPIEVLRWMEHNADIGMTLDVPPLIPGSMKSFEDFEMYKKYSDKSKKNYELMHRSRRSDDLEILKVIHGASPRELQYFYDNVAHLDFDGYAFSPKPAREEQIALTISFAKHIGAKKVHIFLGTGMSTLPVIIYGKRFFERLTYDSASFSLQGAKFRSYVLPFKPSSAIDFGKNYTGTLDRLPCNCPVCQISTVDIFNIDKHTTTAKLSESLPGGLIALHNLYVWLSYMDFLEALSSSYEHYIQFLRVQGFQDAIAAIEMMRKVEEIGYEDVIAETAASKGTDARTIFE